MASTRRSLLPDIKFTHHSPASSDRRYVDSYGTLLTADGTSPTVVKRVDTTPRSSFSEHQNGNDTVEPTSSVMGATFNLANGIVGAGIVGLPYALNQGGFFFGITTICFCCYLTHYTVTLMIETGRAHGRFSYEELCEQAFGKTGFYVLSLFQLFNSFGACCVYILVISTTLPSVTALYLGTVQFWLFDNVSVITILTSLSILLPLSLHRNMSHLEKWSFLSLCTVIILATIVTMTFLSEEKMSSYAIENATTMLYDIHNDWAPCKLVEE
jgi:amino acid permease